jgi:anaerobic magnesium-protoporphyrin IX monomethyl ester cyclase
MQGVFLAKALGATTMAIGTHVTPTARDTLEAFPALDFALRCEPEETARELVCTLEAIRPNASDGLSSPEPCDLNLEPLTKIAGIAYRRNGQVVVNPDRPFIQDLDMLPIPRHELLPLERYKLPIVGGRYTFVVTSRGCPAGYRFCVKHVTYQNTFRLRSPDHIMREPCVALSAGQRHADPGRRAVDDLLGGHARPGGLEPARAVDLGRSYRPTRRSGGAVVGEHTMETIELTSHAIQV